MQNSDQFGHLVFLGTGTSQGIPVIGCECEVCASSDPRDSRSRSSLYVRVANKAFLIDCGPDFRSQMLANNLTHIDAVLLTHEHQDHIAGMDDLRPIIFRTGKPIHIYGQTRTLNRVQKVFDYAFSVQPYPGAPRFELHAIEDESCSIAIGEVQVQPIPVMHGKLPILGYRIGQMAYLTDTNGIPKASLALLQDLDVLILDALHHRDHYSHFTLEQAVSCAQQVGAKRTYFIHASHEMGSHEANSSTLPNGMFISYDGLALDFEL